MWDTLERRRIQPYAKQCRVCTAGFLAKRSDGLFCSSRCGRIDWAARYPERYQTSRNRSRVLRLYQEQASPGVSERDWRRLVTRYDGRCAYCGGKPAVIHMDHVVPLARGGFHQIGNVLPSCVNCNSSKGATFLSAWRRKAPTVALGARR